MNNSEFKLGQKVELNSGSPVMTITEIIGKKYIKVCYVDADKKSKQIELNRACVKPI